MVMKLCWRPTIYCPMLSRLDGNCPFSGPAYLPHHSYSKPNWPEILRELRPGEKASDRPDIVGRIFNLECNAIIAELKAGLFGIFAGNVWTVEYQARIASSLHLAFLTPEAAALHRDPRNVDRVICAEIPSAAEFCDKYSLHK